MSPTQSTSNRKSASTSKKAVKKTPPQKPAQGTAKTKNTAKAKPAPKKPSAKAPAKSAAPTPKEVLSVAEKASAELGGNSVSSKKRLEALLKETEQELSKLQPGIEKLEKEMEKLRELRHTKQKLISLKLSLQTILENFHLQETEADFLDLDADLGPATATSFQFKPLVAPVNSAGTTPRLSSRPMDPYADKTFYPDQAMSEAEDYLKQRGSLNYELFRAIVLNGGRATTQQIKQFLVENQICLPGNGESFEETPLTDISSRVNYLVRKDLVLVTGRGRFASKLGWQ